MQGRTNSHVFYRLNVYRMYFDVFVYILYMVAYIYAYVCMHVCILCICWCDQDNYAERAKCEFVCTCVCIMFNNLVRWKSNEWFSGVPHSSIILRYNIYNTYVPLLLSLVQVVLRKTCIYKFFFPQRFAYFGYIMYNMTHHIMYIYCSK